MKIIFLILTTVFGSLAFSQSNEAITDRGRMLEKTNSYRSNTPTALEKRVALAYKAQADTKERTEWTKALPVRSWEYKKSGSKYKGKYLKKDAKSVWITLKTGKIKKMSIKSLKKADRVYISKVE